MLWTDHGPGSPGWQYPFWQQLPEPQEARGLFGELAITAFIVLPLVLFMLAVMVPVMLKFGAEKGRIAVVICFAVVYLTIALLAQSAEQWGKDFLPLLDSLPEIGIGNFSGDPGCRHCFNLTFVCKDQYRNYKEERIFKGGNQI